MIIGNATVKTPDMYLEYDKSGMKCYIGDQFARLIVDPETALSDYDSIFRELERIEEEFFEKESEYVKKCRRKKTAYAEKGTSLLSKKWVTERIMQAYLLLAYHFYFDMLGEISSLEQSRQM